MMLGWAVLDATDWARLFHAYGAATDTPDAVRGLTGDEASFSRALDHLDGAVLHQGTIYPATAPVVRVLIGVLSEPALRQADASGGSRLHSVVQFLGGVGESAGWVDPEPVTVDAADEDAFYAGLAAGDDEVWECEALDALHTRGLSSLLATAPDVLDALLPLLGDADDGVRLATIAAVGRWAALDAASDRRPAALTALLPLADGRPRDERASAVLALGDAGADTARWLTDADPAIRACAALALPDDPRATAELVSALCDPRAVDGWFTRRPDRFLVNPHFVLLRTLLKRGRPFAEILPAALALIRLANGHSARYDLEPLLLAAFPGVPFSPGVRPPAPTTLDAAQRAFLDSLVANESLWDPTNGNAHLARMRVGLPDSRDAVAALVRSLG